MLRAISLFILLEALVIQLLHILLAGWGVALAETDGECVNSFIISCVLIDRCVSLFVGRLLLVWGGSLPIWKVVASTALWSEEVAIWL